MLDESNLANPTTSRADKACKLAKGITDMARATVEKLPSARCYCYLAARCLPPLSTTTCEHALTRTRATESDRALS